MHNIKTDINIALLQQRRFPPEVADCSVVTISNFSFVVLMLTTGAGLEAGSCCPISVLESKDDRG